MGRKGLDPSLFSPLLQNQQHGLGGHVSVLYLSTFEYWAQQRPWLVTSRVQPIIYKSDSAKPTLRDRVAVPSEHRIQSLPHCWLRPWTQAVQIDPCRMPSQRQSCGHRERCSSESHTDPLIRRGLLKSHYFTY